MKQSLNTISRSRYGLLFSLIAILLTGCGHTPGSGKERNDITLKITFGGEPVTEGVVNLENPQTGEGGGGTLSEEGTATISGVVLGTYTVVVLPPDPDPVPPEPGKPSPPPKTYENIPAKFRQNQSSPLKVDVTADSAEFEFDLKNEG